MHLLRVIIASISVLLLANNVATNKSKDKVDLLHLTVATNETDGLRRLLKSVQVYGIESKVLGLGEQWQGGNLVTEAGGGQKINILKKELEKHKDKYNLVILFTDGYDVIVTGDEEAILKEFFALEANIAFASEDFCWPDKSLHSEYPFVLHGYRYLNSGGFIGYAPQLYEMVQGEIGDKEDDQLYYTKIFLNSDLRTKLNIKLDTQANIFQNLNGNIEDVALDFQEEDTVLINSVYHTRPLIIHGNGPTTVNLNSLGNYLAKSWIKGKGCTFCYEDRVVLTDKKESEFPEILIGIFVTKPTPFLEEMLHKVSSLSYPKRKTYIYVYINIPTHSDHVKKWVEKLKDGKYNGVKMVTAEDNLNEVQARNLALDKCLAISCDAYFNVDSEVQLDNEHILEILISYNKSVISPIMTQPGKLWSTFWGAVSNTGFYARSSDYMEIVNNERRGIWNVPHIYGVYLISKSILENPKTRPDYSYYSLDQDIAMSRYFRDKDIFMYAVNLMFYGHLVNVEAVATNKLHGDLWQVAANSYDWESKYLHPQYYEALEPSFKNEMPCTDVYWFPIFTERFASDMIEEMEHNGEWSGGKNEDPRLAGGYENVPTDDIHMNQIGFEQEWLYILKEYIKPLAEKVYVGYTSDAKAIMNFVVRYKPTAQSFLRPHHDSSTYTINVGLNRPGIDYEGGGSHFIRQNCSVKATKVGWAIMHPGRLTHYHEGLPTTKGTRYILVSFIDP